MVKEPHENAKKIYQFTGQNWTKQVVEYISQHTRSTEVKSTWRKNVGQIDRMSTYKNYRSQKWPSWRRELSKDLTKRVQKQCASVMKKLKYKRLKIS